MNRFFSLCLVLLMATLQAFAAEQDKTEQYAAEQDKVRDYVEAHRPRSFLIGLGIKDSMTQENMDLALIEASKEGDIEMIKRLIEEGANQDFVREEFTPLIAASLNGHLEAVILLWNYGAAVNINTSRKRFKNGWTALMAACEGKYFEIAEFLLKNEAYPNVLCWVWSPKGFSSPLHLVSSRGDIKFVKLLLEKGAEVDYTNGHGGTALMFAVASGHIETAELLLDYGADVNHDSPSYKLRNAFCMACRVGENDLVKLLLQRGANVTRAALYHVDKNSYQMEDRKEIVRMLLILGAKFTKYASYCGINPEEFLHEYRMTIARTRDFLLANLGPDITLYLATFLGPVNVKPVHFKGIIFDHEFLDQKFEEEELRLEKEKSEEGEPYRHTVEFYRDVWTLFTIYSPFSLSTSLLFYPENFGSP